MKKIMMKLAMATPEKLARINAILDDTDGARGKEKRECRLVTYTEAARRLKLSRPTIYRLAKQGRLRIVELNGVNRISLQSVFDFCNH